MNSTDSFDFKKNDFKNFLGNTSDARKKYFHVNPKIKRLKINYAENDSNLVFYSFNTKLYFQIDMQCHEKIEDWFKKQNKV